MPENVDSINPDGIIEGYSPASQDAELIGEGEESLLAKLKERLDVIRQIRKPRHADWEYNKLALHGYVNIGRLRDSDTVLRVVTYKSLRKPPSTDNVLLPVVRAWVGKMLRSLPDVEVKPPNSKASARQGAEGLSALLRFFKRDLKLHTGVMGKGFSWLTYAGNFVVIPMWDPTGGEIIATCPTCNYTGKEKQIGQHCPTCMKKETLRVSSAVEEHNQLIMEAESLAIPAENVPHNPENPPKMIDENVPDLERSQRGKLQVELFRIQEVFFDSGATSLDQVQHFTAEKPYSVSELRRTYPDAKDYLLPDSNLMDDRYIGVDQYGRRHLHTRELKDHMLLRITFERPTAQHEDGRVIHWVDGKVLKIQKYTEYRMLGRHKAFLFRADHFDDTDLLGRAPIEDAYSIQDERNKQLRDMRAHRSHTGNAKFIAPADGGINQKTMDDTTAQVILLNRLGMHFKPYYLTPPPMAPYTQTELDRMSAAIREKLGITPHEVGLTKSGESGRYAAHLEAQANETLKAIIESNNEEYVDLNRALLILGHHYMDEDQLWSMEAQGVMKYYCWSDIAIEPPYEVHAVQTDALSKNPVVRAEQAGAWWQMGLFNDDMTGKPDKRKYATVAGITDIVVDTDSDVMQKRYARELIEQIKRTHAPPKMHSWTNPLIVSREFLIWLQEEGYEEEDVVALDIIEKTWFFLAQAALIQEQIEMAEAQGMKSAGVQPNPMMLQSAQSAGGAGGQPTERDPGRDTEAAQGIKAADESGEAMARGGKPHEG